MLSPNKTGYVFYNTANIYFQVFGEDHRPVIMFIHGNREDWHAFDKQIRPFSKLYRIVTIDSRGHGRSSFGMRPLTIELMADDVIAVMDELKIEQANIIGFSDGGNIAIQIALQHPERIKKLVLAGANLYPTGMKMVSQIPIVIAYLLCRITSRLSKRAKKKASLLDLMVHQPNFDSEELKRIQSPTLVLAGEKDVIKEEHTKLIARCIPTSKLQVLEGVNHFIFKEESKKVNFIILSYLYKKK